MPTTWLITLDSILSVSCLAGAVVFLRLWSKQYPEPAEITKISIGSIIAVTGFLSLAASAAIAAATGAKCPFGWLITFHLLTSIGFANVFPVSLALYARVAPAALSATIIGIYYLAFFAANNLVGWIGGFLEKMPVTNFWCYTPRSAEQPVSSSSLPAGSLVTSWRQAITKAPRNEAGAMIGKKMPGKMSRTR